MPGCSAEAGRRGSATKLHLRRRVEALREEGDLPVPFQLVLATDDQISVWHTDHGHIYVFEIDPKARGLVTGWCKDIAEAPVRAETLRDEARLFAEAEARSRRLIA
jgi:hypothetical protein